MERACVGEVPAYMGQQGVIHISTRRQDGQAAGLGDDEQMRVTIKQSERVRGFRLLPWGARPDYGFRLSEPVKRGHSTTGDSYQAVCHVPVPFRPGEMGESG